MNYGLLIYLNLKTAFAQNYIKELINYILYVVSNYAYIISKILLKYTII